MRIVQSANRVSLAKHSDEIVTITPPYHNLLITLDINIADHDDLFMKPVPFNRAPKTKTIYCQFSMLSFLVGPIPPVFTC
jgi:hypothetical protein